MKPAHLLLRLPDDDGKPDLHARALPLKSAVPKRGETVAAFLRRVEWSFMGLPTVCRIGKKYYQPEEWETKKLTSRSRLAFIQRPGQGGGGGGGKRNILGAVAMLALVVLTAAVAGPIAGMIGVSAQIVGTIMLAGGSMLISHFLKPKAAGKGKKDDLQSFLTGTNQARPLQTIPVGYGRRLTIPDVCDPPYSEFDGDGMMSYSLYCIGAGEYDVEELRLNDTPFWRKADGILAEFDGRASGTDGKASTAPVVSPGGLIKSGGSTPSYAGIEIEIIPPGQNVTLFPINVVTSSGYQPAELTEVWPAPVIINASGTSVKKIVLDIVFPSGLFYSNPKKGKIGARGVTMMAEIQAVDSAGVPTGGWVQAWTETYSSSQQSQIRLTRRFDVAPGRYQIRVKRSTAALADTTNGPDNVYLQAVRAWIDGPQSVPDVTRIALKIPASKKLAHLNSAKVGAIQTRKLNHYDTAANQWTFGPTRSIAWALYDIWTNQTYSAGLPADRIDLANLIALDQKWAALGHTFDHFFTDPITVMSALETVANAGRSYPNVIGDTLAFTRDEPRLIPRLALSDNEVVRGSFKRTTRLYRPEYADGVVGSYLDENTWKPAEVSSAGDGVLLAKPARVELIGVTKRTQAAGLIRFQAADSLLRRQTVSFDTELDGFLCRRGDLIAVQTELPQSWGAAAKAMAFAAGTGALTLMAPMAWASGAQHYIEVRDAYGGYWGPVKCARGADDATAVIDMADAAIVAGQQGKTIADALGRNSGEEIPSVVLGTASNRMAHVLVTEGQPSGPDHITITGVVDNPAVYDVTETGVAPQPTVPAIYSPPVSVIVFTASGVVQAGANLVLRAAWLATAAETYIVQYRNEPGGTWVTIERPDPASTYFEYQLPLPVTDTMTIRVAGILKGGLPGQWSVQTVSVPTLALDGEYLTINNVGLDALSNDLVGKLAGAGPGSINEALTAAQTRAADLDLVARATLEGLATLNDRIGAADSARARATQVLSERVTEGGVATASLKTDLVAEKAANTARYSGLVQAIAAGDAAEASRVDALIAQTATQTAGQINAAIYGEATARASGDDALASYVGALSAEVVGARAGQASLSAKLVAMETARAAGDTAEAQRVDALIAQAATQTAGQINAAVSGEASARVAGDAAQAARTDDIVAEVSGARGGAASLSARITAVEQTASTATSAVATRATSLETRMTSAEPAITAAQNAASAAQSTATGAVNEVASARNGQTTLSARLTQIDTASVDRDNQIAGTVTTAQTAAQNADAKAVQALASAASATQSAATLNAQVQAVFGGNMANSMLYIASAADAQGANSELGFFGRTTVNGTPISSGMKIRTNQTGGSVAFDASSFLLSDPNYNGGSPVNVFNYTNGKFRFGVPVGFDAGFIDTAAIAFDAISGVEVVTRFAGTLTGAGSTPLAANGNGAAGVSVLSKYLSSTTYTTNDYCEVAFDPSKDRYVSIKLRFQHMADNLGNQNFTCLFLFTRDTINSYPTLGNAYSGRRINTQTASDFVVISDDPWTKFYGVVNNWGEVAFERFDEPPAAGTYRYRVYAVYPTTNIYFNNVMMRAKAQRR